MLKPQLKAGFESDSIPSNENCPPLIMINTYAQGDGNSSDESPGSFRGGPS